MKSINLCLSERSGPGAFRLLVLTSLLLGPLLFPALSAAVNLSGDSRTYLQSRETAIDQNILGVYEYLDFAVQNVGNETISFHTGGWLRYDLRDEQFGRKSNNDLQYSYLSFRAATDDTVVNLGRVMVFEGVASERVDGVYARTDMAAGFGISAFAGNPVETNSDLSGNDLIYGGRIGHQGGDLYRIGVSALKVEKDSDDYREEQGVDLWLHPMNRVDITGRSSYNGVTKGWMEHAYALSLGPFDKVRLNTEASWINYDDYFFRATISAFALQPGLLTPHEGVRILGQDISYAATDKLYFTADYKNFNYDIAGNANYYGGKVNYAYSSVSGSGFSYHRMEGESDRLQYDEYRLYGYTKIDRTNLAVDVIDISYANAINGVDNSYSLSVAALYDLNEAWKMGADAEYSRNPDFDRDVRAFVKVLYRFGSKGGV